MCAEQEIEASTLTAPNLAAVQQRIKDVVRVLDNFSALRDPERPRKDYVAQVSILPASLAGTRLAVSAMPAFN